MGEMSEIWLHKKAGGLYFMICEAATLGSDTSYMQIVVYRCLRTGNVWAMSHVEFHNKHRQLTKREAGSLYMR